jgi:hypothetical protein
MQKVHLSLSNLSFAQKLDLMETIWTDLIRKEEKPESPAWHEPILKDREEALSKGKISISDWSEAKKRIKRKIS